MTPSPTHPRSRTPHLSLQVVLQKMGIPDGEMKAQLDGDTKDGGDDAEPVFNPFTQPFILLTLIFIRPLRRTPMGIPLWI